MNINQILYNAGLTLLALGAVGSIFSLLFFCKLSKKLQKQLEAEYGKPRHS